MPDLTNYDGRLEQMALYCEAMLDNIAKLNNAYQVVSNDEYSVALPADMIKFKGVKKVGGKTIVWNQLVNTGTVTVSVISGHKYYTLIDGTASIITSDGTAISVVDDTADMVCDLTLMFGSGNEPGTTSAFTDIFSSTHDSYNAGTLLSAGVTYIVSKDSDDTTLQTISIPAEVQAIDGYGWSAGSVSNYIDFERKKFVKCVGRVDMGTLTWNTPSTNMFTSTPIADCKPPVGSAGIPNIVTNDYIVVSYSNLSANLYVITVVFSGSAYEKRVYAKDDRYDTIDDFKAHINGQYLYYELATPVETDISEYLTDDILLKAEAGGTLTFPNNNGDNYHVPVPSEIEYIGLT